MSYDIYLEPPKGYGGTVEVGNSTSNHSPAWAKALGYPMDELEGRKAGDVAAELQAAAKHMRQNPDVYEDLVRGDGSWGNAHHAQEYMQRLADLCEKHQHCRVRVSH